MAVIEKHNSLTCVCGVKPVTSSFPTPALILQFRYAAFAMCRACVIETREDLVTCLARINKGEARRGRKRDELEDLRCPCGGGDDAIVSQSARNVVFAFCKTCIGAMIRQFDLIIASPESKDSTGQPRKVSIP